MNDGIYDPQPWEKPSDLVNSPLSRRRLLQLMGYGAAGMVGSGILTACGDSNSPQPVNGPSTPVGTVTSGLGTVRQISPYFLGYNNVPIHSPSWDNPDVVKAATQMKPGTLRYPGGTVANYWDWRSGWFVPRALSSFLSAPRSIYRLQELQIVVQATGAIPIYVLNMLTSDLNTQLEMLRTAKRMGLPVQFVELGNEFYLRSPDDYIAKFPTGADYGKMATTWIQAIRSQFPDVQIAAVGGVPVASPSDDPRKANWTNDLLQHLQGADALTWHPYTSLKQGTITPSAPSDIGVQLYNMVSDRWQQFENGTQSLPANMKLWITEFNFVDPSKQVFYKWIDGIFAARMSLNFLAEERTELVCYYDMVGKTGNEVIFYNQQSQGSGNSSLAPFALTAAGWSMRLLGDTLHSMTSAQQISFSSGSVSGSETSLQGWTFSDGKLLQAFIINSGAVNFTWTVDAAFTRGGNFQQLAGDPFKTITGSDSLSLQSNSLGSQLVLPAYSVTQLKRSASA